MLNFKSMTKETLRLFWRASWRYKWLIIGSEIGATFFTLSADILSPLVISKIIDKLAKANVDVLTFNDFKTLLFFFLALRVIYLVSGRLMMLTYIRLEPNVIRDLENLSFEKLQGHSMAFFADNFSGALVAKVNRLTAAYQRFIETVLGDFGMLFRRYVAALIVLIFINPLIAAVFAVWSVAFCLSLLYLHSRKLGYSKAASAAQTEVTARLADIITNTLTIRSFARTNDEIAHFKKLSNDRRNLRYRSYLISDYIRIYKSTAIIILEAIVLIMSIKFGLTNQISIGAIVLIQFYLFQLISQLWNFGRFMDRLEESLADAAEMTEIIMLPHEVTDPPSPEKLKIKNGQIDFNNVAFQYSDSDKRSLLFKDLDIHIASGEKVGIVGHSGGGKTTITKLLLRFMDLASGEILIDGQNIANVKQDDLRSVISYVPQEPLLFHRSIFENIAYGKPDATKSEVKAIARKANADEFIDNLPRGYETMVGERGVKLSGGQRQRVAIARAMLRNSQILILDEATSSLDSESEKLIQDALWKLMEGRTAIVIAHRLSTIQKMDRILVLEEGKVIEEGSHKELLARNGVYASLWNHQSGGFLEE